jgi:hypothetical protein
MFDEEGEENKEGGSESKSGGGGLGAMMLKVAAMKRGQEAKGNSEPRQPSALEIRFPGVNDMRDASRDASRVSESGSTLLMREQLDESLALEESFRENELIEDDPHGIHLHDLSEFSGEVDAADRTVALILVDPDDDAAIGSEGSEIEGTFV